VPYFGDVLVRDPFEVVIDLVLLVILELLDHGETTAISDLLLATVSDRTGSRTFIVFPRSREMVFVVPILPFLAGLAS
jgi:hypothetical protein